MTYAALNISSKSICSLGLNPQHLQNGFLYTSPLTEGRCSQTSLLKCSGSHTVCFSTTLFMEKLSWWSNKTLGLASLPKNPSCSYLYDQSSMSQVTNQGDSVFEKKKKTILSGFLEWIRFTNQGSTGFSKHLHNYNGHWVLSWQRVMVLR